jgi:hypothetical protein
MTKEQIAQEEFIAREDLLLGAELMNRINAIRQRLREKAGALTTADLDEIYELLGQCNQELSKVAYDRQQDQLRMLEVIRTLQQMCPPEKFTEIETKS